ncbi:MAG: hypothetical protein JO276_16125 [Sphingomonadaceae bacterium]|nr:hypothetical protein [Sphingomonadaceae bacterium]
MRKFLISVALVSTALTAAPALAQDYGHRGYDQRGDHRGDWNRGGPDRPAVNNLLRQLDQVESRIQRSLQRRAISFREAASLRREANDIRVRANVRGRDGLSGREFAQLQVRVNRLEQRLRFERRDDDRRPY